MARHCRPDSPGALGGCAVSCRVASLASPGVRAAPPPGHRSTSASPPRAISSLPSAQSAMPSATRPQRTKPDPSPHRASRAPPAPAQHASATDRNAASQATLAAVPPAAESGSHRRTAAHLPPEIPERGAAAADGAALVAFSVAGNLGAFGSCSVPAAAPAEADFPRRAGRAASGTRISLPGMATALAEASGLVITSHTIATARSAVSAIAAQSTQPDSAPPDRRLAKALRPRCTLTAMDTRARPGWVCSPAAGRATGAESRGRSASGLGPGTRDPDGPGSVLWPVTAGPFGCR